ncbi:hypothetical protein P167DRAFT_603059 [Morchella conica CCBAS932]|uniref:Transcription factor CBF/NF-Y/archaeal histone domain-containing protein n=1 Tax=Morchella conica CCBAS932 TaxID=1392247 RepID=A0A3N4LC01_9PEZI|nr:hypothetical protein P167DRAFT_603059 [Morchella conica CCBAS932]
MAPQKAYPRSVLKRIVKAHSDRNVSKNVDVLIYLDYALFLQELVREAVIHAQTEASADGATSTATKNKKPVISARDVRKVSKVIFVNPS